LNGRFIIIQDKALEIKFKITAQNLTGLQVSQEFPQYWEYNGDPDWSIEKD